MRLNDIEIAGKTGTSQVIGRRPGADAKDDFTPPHLRPHAWFVCYAPYGAPKIAIAVLVENGEHGSSAAGPIAREMVKAYLRGDRRAESGGGNRCGRGGWKRITKGAGFKVQGSGCKVKGAR